MVRKKVSPPSASGGEGYRYEHKVGAYYLVQLLNNQIPRGLEDCNDNGTISRISFQNQWAGLEVDDIAIYSKKEINRESKLVLQIKESVTFSEKNLEFVKVINECWMTFTSEEFNPELDYLGIVIGVISKKIATNFVKLRQWARDNRNASEFFNRINTEGYSNKEMQKQLEILRGVISSYKEDHICSDDEIWRFLKYFVVIHLELSDSGGRDYNSCLNSLKSIVLDNDPQITQMLLGRLFELSSRYDSSGGSIDFDMVFNKLPSQFLALDNITGFWEKWAAVLDGALIRKIRYHQKYSSKVWKSFEKIIKEGMVAYNASQLLKNDIDRLTQNGFDLINQISKEILLGDREIFYLLGKISAPPYLSSGIINSHLFIQVQMLLEEKPELNRCIPKFLEGFANISFETIYLDTLHMGEIEHLLFLIEQNLLIPFQYRNPRKEMRTAVLIDDIDEFLHTLGKGFASKLSIADQYMDAPIFILIIRRSIQTIITFYQKYFPNNIYNLGKIANFLNLDLPISLQYLIIEEFGKVVGKEEIIKNDSNYCHFMCSLQTVWSNIVTEDNLANPSPNDEFIEKDFGQRIPNMARAKYNPEVHRILTKFIERLFTYYSSFIKSSSFSIDHPNSFIKELNRSFVDLMVLSLNLKPKDGLDIDVILNNLLEIIISRFNELYSESPEYSQVFLTPSILILNFLYSTEKSKILSSLGATEFERLLLVGLCILRDEHDLLTEKITEYKSIIPKIKEIYQPKQALSCVQSEFTRFIETKSGGTHPLLMYVSDLIHQQTYSLQDRVIIEKIIEFLSK